MKKNKPTQQGFSLLEVLMAFSILALSLGILLNIFSGGVKTAAVAEDYTVAVQIAESLMAATGAEIALKSHSSRGVANDRYRWSLTINPYFLTPATIDPKNAAAELYKVNATVAWGEEDEEDRVVEITTLKLAAKSAFADENAATP